jgi:pimeloyl-ACP methyl ester carboxylesterase
MGWNGRIAILVTAGCAFGTLATATRADEPSAPSDPPTPTPAAPSAPFALDVPGYEPAAVVAPETTAAGPWRLVVILHGNYARPEWECATWSVAARGDSWLLCPRGVPREDADASLDRWTYLTAHQVAEETAAAVQALRDAYPGKVRDDGAVLIGFSLGAHMAWKVAADRAAPAFERIVFGEGGYFVTEDVAARAVRRGVLGVVLLCGEQTRCNASFDAAEGIWRDAGVSVDRLTMPDTGHAYAADFEPFANEIFGLL